MAAGIVTELTRHAQRETDPHLRQLMLVRASLLAVAAPSRQTRDQRRTR
jgi:hypothetical protein